MEMFRLSVVIKPKVLGDASSIIDSVVPSGARHLVDRPGTENR